MNNLDEVEYLLTLKKVKDLKGFYYNFTAFCIVMPCLIYINLTYYSNSQWCWYCLIGWGISLLVQAPQVFHFLPFVGWKWEEREIKQSLKNEINKIIMENFNNDQFRVEKARKRVKAIGGFYKHLTVYIIVNIALLAINYFDHDNGEVFFRFNNFSTAIFWGIGLLFHGFSVFGTCLFLGNDWEERKMKEFMEVEKTKKSNWE